MEPHTNRENTASPEPAIIIKPPPPRSPTLRSSTVPMPGPPPPKLPPPPPPPSGAKSLKVKPKTRRLNWKKLLSQQIPGTLFQVLRYTCIRYTTNSEQAIDRQTSLKVDAIALQNAFAISSSPAPSTPPIRKSVMPESILDHKKSQNLGILLKSIRAPYAEIKNSILTFNSSILSVGNAISLLKLLPTDDEVSKCTLNLDIY